MASIEFIMLRCLLLLVAGGVLGWALCRCHHYLNSRREQQRQWKEAGNTLEKSKREKMVGREQQQRPMATIKDIRQVIIGCYRDGIFLKCYEGCERMLDDDD